MSWFGQFCSAGGFSDAKSDTSTRWREPFECSNSFQAQWGVVQCRHSYVCPWPASLAVIVISCYLCAISYPVFHVDAFILFGTVAVASFVQFVFECWIISAHGINIYTWIETPCTSGVTDDRGGHPNNDLHGKTRIGLDCHLSKTVWGSWLWQVRWRFPPSLAAGIRLLGGFRGKEVKAGRLDMPPPWDEHLAWFVCWMRLGSLRNKFCFYGIKMIKQLSNYARATPYMNFASPNSIATGQRSTRQREAPWQMRKAHSILNRPRRRRQMRRLRRAPTATVKAPAKLLKLPRLTRCKECQAQWCWVKI